MRLLTEAQQILRATLAQATSAVTACEKQYDELSAMHSQLSKLNVERQKTINTLVEMAKNLYSLAKPFMDEGDSVWIAMQEEYVAALKLAERESGVQT